MMKTTKMYRKWLLVIFVIAGIALVIYGGYRIVRQVYLPKSHKIHTLLQASELYRFASVSPEKSVILPHDFAIHPEYQHEWWHVFANVYDAEGKEYGVQWNFFRVANDDRQDTGWQSSQLFLSHVVISNPHQVWKEQRIARGGIGQADMVAQPFQLWIDNWHWRSRTTGPLPGQLNIETDTFGMSLQMQATGPYLLPGDKGYQKRHATLPVSSYSIYAPFIAVKGSLRLAPNQTPIQVEGQAWMSKEWGSGLFGKDQQGWEWFVLHLDGDKTLAVMRHRYHDQSPYLHGTLTNRSGKVITLTDSDIDMLPLSVTKIAGDKEIPLQWHISVPSQNINITTDVVNPNLWLPFALPYWEGPIHSTGSHQARGFMQLTGY